MQFTPERFREHFPALEGGAFFDNAGGTQTPLPVAQAIAEALMGGLSQRGAAYAAARKSEKIVKNARQAMGDFLNVPADGVIFGRSATALIFDFARTLTADLRPGDEVVVSRLDHDANVRPWVLAAEAAGATIRWIDFDKHSGDLTTGHARAVITDHTKIVALGAASNLYGTKPNIPAISALAAKVGAVMFVDAVAYAPHELVDLPALGADYVVCSPYKFFGPHLGVLAANPSTLEKLRPAKLVPSPNTVPERFEHGTLPYELLAGVSATVDLLSSFSPAKDRRERLAEFYSDSGEHERMLSEKIIAGLAEIPGIARVGAPTAATPTVFFTVEGATPDEVAEFLGGHGIAVSAGSFYAHEAVQWANLGAGGIRLSLAPYNVEGEVDQLLAALREFATR